MKRLILLCAAGACASLVLAAQLSVIVLNTQSWRTGGNVPDGWQVKVNRGTPDVSAAQDADGNYLHLKSQGSSFAVERSVDVDPGQMPYLSWRWKVTRLPDGGDFRRVSTDDQAAQVLVAFNDRRVLTYLWDTSAPKGTMRAASSIPLVHIYAIVCRSGPAEMNQWVVENRNFAADYEKAFGRQAPRVKGIRLQINSQHTQSSAESYFGDVVFRSTP